MIKVRTIQTMDDLKESVKDLSGLDGEVDELFDRFSDFFGVNKAYEAEHEDYADLEFGPVVEFDADNISKHTRLFLRYHAFEPKIQLMAITDKVHPRDFQETVVLEALSRYIGVELQHSRERSKFVMSEYFPQDVDHQEIFRSLLRVDHAYHEYVAWQREQDARHENVGSNLALKVNYAVNHKKFLGKNVDV